MKPIFPIALLICILPLTAVSEDKASEQLLMDARHQANIFHKDAEPFQLEADFSAQTQLPLQGHVTLKWESRDHWWRKIVMADFVQVDIHNAERQYTVRNAAFTPQIVQELTRLLEFNDYATGTVKKQKRSSEGGTDLTCLHMEKKGLGHMTYEICINPAALEIVRNESTFVPDDKHIERYTEYSDFQGRRYPRKLELLANGSKLISLTIKDLASSAFDEALLMPPKGAIERSFCKGMVPPVPIKTPDPLYPKSASENRMMGDTVVTLTILTDGSVGDVQLLESATQSMNSATLQTLKTWKFKPAMCGTEPVITDISVAVSFRLGP